MNRMTLATIRLFGFCPIAQRTKIFRGSELQLRQSNWKVMRASAPEATARTFRRRELQLQFGMQFILLFILICVTASASVAALQPQTYLYKATLVQAAPGKLVDLIALYKSMWAEQSKHSSEPAPFWMRHSQGDRWDLLILFPAGSYTDYYQPDRAVAREKAAQPWNEKLKQDIAWQEDVFVYGTPLELVKKAFSNAGFFHVEMFEALAGKQPELLKEREMENAFARSVKQPENLIFVRDQGAAWDLFTIGCYRNLKHYAESGDVAGPDREAAAKAAGFASGDDIGPYLRKFISLHHDTLAVAVK
jgi:hypothetical protein